MFTKNTVASILSAHTATIAKLLTVQAEQTVLAEKKFVESAAAINAAETV